MIVNIFSISNETMIKYIFSDFNRGVPLYPGCLNKLINWIPSLIGAIGACLITSAIIQIVGLIFALKLMSYTDEDSIDK